MLSVRPLHLGAVVEVLPGTTEDRIKIFVDGNIQTYYASQLQADDHHLRVIALFLFYLESKLSCEDISSMRNCVVHARLVTAVKFCIPTVF